MQLRGGLGVRPARKTTHQRDGHVEFRPVCRYTCPSTTICHFQGYEQMNVINVYAHRDGESWEEIERAIKNANGLQSSFSFKLIHSSGKLSGLPNEVSFNDLEREISSEAPAIRGLIF